MRQSNSVIAVLKADEADALVKFGSVMEEFIRRDSPLDRATAKLDEQSAAQYRDPYKEAEDELRDRLAFHLLDHQHNSMDWEVLAKAVVDRILGVYEP